MRLLHIKLSYGCTHTTCARAHKHLHTHVHTHTHTYIHRVYVCVCACVPTCIIGCRLENGSKRLAVVLSCQWICYCMSMFLVTSCSKQQMFVLSALAQPAGQQASQYDTDTVFSTQCIYFTTCRGESYLASCMEW